MQRKLRILVVEDEAAIRSGLIDVFVFHGYDVEGVADGQEGLERALGGTFDSFALCLSRPGQNALYQFAAEHFPPQAEWTRPAGGLFVWATLAFTIASSPDCSPR